MRLRGGGPLDRLVFCSFFVYIGGGKEAETIKGEENAADRNCKAIRGFTAAGSGETALPESEQLASGDIRGKGL